ncbi:protein-L-isoaspartate(D-aspartate) O-methyltransferase [Nocardiopsis alba]|uniref:Protein-L-isoaspartate O-methyltransferase n=1 Tax=Nocardiopsis alba TaxID=53437 RepID=A0A7K2IPR8_9ACTN|nr:protein-L-isoaspartate(D-aspartate) O-methyltransferase [Nocardiopsis alba]MYR31972.1 protein-L-isoaspartate(D-aspartate) O-methyltransferase [Nocardiopsis alba]
MELDQRHARLIERLETTEAVRAAFADHPRHRFIPDLVWSEVVGPPLSRTDAPEEWAEYVYSDGYVVTQANEGGEATMNTPTSSSSAPQIMADMIRAARIVPGMRVLEIGTGTGWNAAILSSLVGPEGTVTTVEVDPRIAEQASERLERIGVRSVRGPGLPNKETYGAVIATCSVHRVPTGWIEQAEDDASIVVPWAIYATNGPTPIAALRKVGPTIAEGPLVRDASFMRDRTQPVVHKRFPGMDAEACDRGEFPIGSTELLSRDLLTRLALTCPETQVSVGMRPWEGKAERIVALGTDGGWAYIWPDGSTTSGGTRPLVEVFAEAHDLLAGEGWPPLTEFSLEVDTTENVYRVRAPFGVWEHQV